jgi:protein-disulfide isomerase
MKLAPLVALAVFSFTIFASPVGMAAEDDLVSSFSIDEPNQPDITPAMLAKNRTNAIANLTQLLHNPNNPMTGSPIATVTLVEFMDFKCPLSERMDPAIQALIPANPSFRVIYKIIPIHGEVSVYAAKAALAANRQGKYIAYHKAMMAVGKGLTQDKVISIAKSLGIDTVKLKADMNSSEVKQQLDDNMKLFHAIDLLGTPDLFFMKSDITSAAKNSDIILMLGVFTQPELQSVVDKLIP